MRIRPEDDVLIGYVELSYLIIFFPTCTQRLFSTVVFLKLLAGHYQEQNPYNQDTENVQMGSNHLRPLECKKLDSFKSSKTQFQTLCQSSRHGGYFLCMKFDDH